MANNTLSQPQPQIAQLELVFKGPLVKDQQVDTVADLLTLKAQFNYVHKLVWVKEYKTFYFLDNGDGTEAINWVKMASRVVINRYDSETAYQSGDCVYLSNKIYTAIQDVPIHTSPLDADTYWLIIAGESPTSRFLFLNVSSIIVYTEIRNPLFEVILGDLVYEADGTTIKVNPVTGLAELENKEIVQAYVIQREDLSNNNGVPYQIIFSENDDLSVMVSGCINVK